MTGNRTLGIKMIQAWPKDQRRNNPNARYFPLDNIEGEDLKAIFDAMNQKIETTPLNDKSKKVTVRVTERLGTGPARLVQYSRGVYGDKGQLYDEATGEASHKLSESESLPMALRCALIVPPGEPFALLFTEHDGASSLATTITDLLLTEFYALGLETQVPGPKKKGPMVDKKVLLHEATYQEPDLWREGANLVEFRVLRKSHQDDFQVGSSSRRLDVQMVESELYLPSLGNSKFAEWFKKALFDAKLDAATFLQVVDPESVDGVEVVLEKDGKSRRFRLGTERAPAYRQVLTAAGMAACTHSQFMTIVKDETERFFERNSRRLRDDWLDLDEYTSA